MRASAHANVSSYAFEFLRVCIRAYVPASVRVSVSMCIRVYVRVYVRDGVHACMRVCEIVNVRV